jgi:hypothetical protein
MDQIGQVIVFSLVRRRRCRSLHDWIRSISQSHPRTSLFSIDSRMRKKLPIRGEEREKLERGRDENPDVNRLGWSICLFLRCTIEHYLAKSRGWELQFRDSNSSTVYNTSFLLCSFIFSSGRLSKNLESIHKGRDLGYFNNFENEFLNKGEFLIMIYFDNFDNKF